MELYIRINCETTSGFSKPRLIFNFWNVTDCASASITWSITYELPVLRKITLVVVSRHGG
jgi:hypothetical protein